MPRAKARALPASLGFKAGPAKLIDPNRPPQPTNPIFNPEGCKQYIIYTVSRPDQPGMQVGIQPCSLSLPCTLNRFGFAGENVKHLPHLVPRLSHFTLSLEICPTLSSDITCVVLVISARRPSTGASLAAAAFVAFSLSSLSLLDTSTSTKLESFPNCPWAGSFEFNAMTTPPNQGVTGSVPYQNLNNQHARLLLCRRTSTSATAGYLHDFFCQ